MSGTFLEVLLRCAAFFGGATLVGLVFGVGAERLAWRRGRKVYDVPMKRGQLRTEVTGTLLFHAVWLPIIALVLTSGTLHFAEGWPAAVTTFVVAWWSFQALYYFLHRAMHLRALFWIHRWHHESLVTSPMTGLSMSPLEALAWAAAFLGPAYLLSAIGMLHAGGWMVFFAAHFVGNVAGHANAEIFPYRVNRLGSIVYSNAIVYHSMHHARFDGHYGFGAALMDWAFGTEWPDWRELHLRIMDGRPLTSLRQRGETSGATTASGPRAPGPGPTTDD